MSQMKIKAYFADRRGFRGHVAGTSLTGGDIWLKGWVDRETLEVQAGCSWADLDLDAVHSLHEMLGAYIEYREGQGSEPEDAPTWDELPIDERAT